MRKMKTSETILLWLRIIISLVCAAINGIDLSFNVYAIPIKETFNFTQTQVEVTASLGCVGFGLVFLETVMTSTFGYTTTFLVSWITMPLSSGLFAIAAVHSEFFHSWPVLLYLIQMLLSTSNGITLVLVARVGVEMLPRKHTGKYIGVHAAFLSFGKIIFSAMFDLFLQNNLCAFFICLSAISAVVLGLCFLLLHPVAMTLENATPVERTQESSVKDWLRSRYFHMMFWPSVIFASVGYTMLNNITSIADSIGVRNSFSIISIFSICITATRAIFGLVYDILSSQSFAFLLLFIMYLSFGTGVILSCYAMNVTTLYVLTVLSGLSLGPAYSLPISMLVAHCGRRSYSFICGSSAIILAASQMILQVLMGYLYQDEIQRLGLVGTYCKGDGCFYWSFVVMLVITALTFVSQTVNCCLLGRQKYDIIPKDVCK